MTKKVLGRGLGALISNLEYSSMGEILEIPIDQLIPNPFQPRKYFDEKKLAELALSIKEKGIIQPLLVRKNDGGYSLIAGERRWRAAQQAGLTKVPVIVKNVNEQEELELSLIENIQREDINPIEEAEAYLRLIELFNYSQDHLASILGKDKSTVSNILRLLKLEEAIKDNIRKNLLTMGQARALLGISDPVARLTVCRQVIEKGLSVRETEALVKNYEEGRKKKRNKGVVRDEQDFFVKTIEDDLKILLGTFVKIKNKKEQGKIEISYSSHDELNRIISLMKE